MLSVSEAANILKVTPSRVRKLIADGVLKAEKIGNAWTISENEVAARLRRSPKAGRPKIQKQIPEQKKECINLHDVYMKLKDGNFTRPSASTMALIKDKDEVGFLLCVCDYFLNVKQRKEIENGVY